MAYPKARHRQLPALLDRLKLQPWIELRQALEEGRYQIIQAVPRPAGDNGMTAPQEDIWLSPGGHLNKGIDPHNEIDGQGLRVHLLQLGNRINGIRGPRSIELNGG